MERRIRLKLVVHEADRVRLPRRGVARSVVPEQNVPVRGRAPTAAQQEAALAWLGFGFGFGLGVRVRVRGGVRVRVRVRLRLRLTER